jgi:magnesium transporter
MFFYTMIERYAHKKITWLDVVSPTQEEIHSIAEECAIPREFTADLTTMTPRTEVFSRKGFLKITLDFPIVKRTDITHPHEVKFLITKNYLITIRFEDITAVHLFSKEFEMLSLLKGAKKSSTEQLFFLMLGLFYESLYEKLDYLEAKLRDIEEEVFSDNEEKMVYELSQVSRRLISFKQTLEPHYDALLKLRDQFTESFGAGYRDAVESLIHPYQILRRRQEALTSTFEDLRKTNDSLLETKQNSIMRVFTILAFITFPLTLFSSMFGMNTEHTPIIGMHDDFWIIVAIMVIVSICFFVYFRHKRWF